MYRFNQIIPTKEDWKRIEGAYDSSCYQTEGWYLYLKRIGVTPFVVAVFENDELIGYFFGEKIRLVITIITAPIEGIGTYTQGLNMLRAATQKERIQIYKALSAWIFKRRIAMAFQVDDWQLRLNSAQWIANEDIHIELLKDEGITYETRPTLYKYVNKEEQELWDSLSYKSCKYSINKARKLGLEVKEITRREEIRAFCKEHYAQLYEVCIRKGQRPKPTQSENRMIALCESLFPKRVLMLEIIGKDEHDNKQIMSTGIFCIDKGECSYWTGASYKRYQKYCPNELMVWEAILRLRRYGCETLNFCGIASYKLKYGCIYAYVPRIKIAKYAIFTNLTHNIKRLYHTFKKYVFDPLSRV